MMFLALFVIPGARDSAREGDPDILSPIRATIDKFEFNLRGFS
jgi:hypothetical protein